MLSFATQDIASHGLALVILTFFEIVLGIDNLVFLAIISGRLPESQQKLARKLGLSLALITRILFLASLFLLIQLTKPLFSISVFDLNLALSPRDLLMLLGGFFLLHQGTHEIHNEIIHKPTTKELRHKPVTLRTAVMHIVFLDIVFSFDSLFTAIGISTNFWVIALAIWLSILAMLFLSEPLTKFINKYPSIKMLALSFLLMIATVLIADGLHFAIPKGYIYFSVFFSLMVETLSIISKKASAVDKKNVPPT